MNPLVSAQMGFAQVAFITCFTLVWTLKASYKRPRKIILDFVMAYLACMRALVFG